MIRSIGLVVLGFFALVSVNLAFTQLQTLTPAGTAAADALSLPRAQAAQGAAPKTKTKAITAASSPTSIPNVPFFSQFADILSPQWQQVGCGVTSLAMVIDFYKPNAVSVNALLQQALAAGAYDQAGGWTFSGLIQLSKKYGLAGVYYDLSELSPAAGLARLRTFLASGPLILSVHNRFNPASSVPHLIVVDGMKNNTVYYNDPAAKTGKKKISTAGLLGGWKGKVIVLRPATGGAEKLSLE